MTHDQPWTDSSPPLPWPGALPSAISAKNALYTEIASAQDADPLVTLRYAGAPPAASTFPQSAPPAAVDLAAFGLESEPHPVKESRAAKGRASTAIRGMEGTLAASRVPERRLHDDARKCILNTAPRGGDDGHACGDRRSERLCGR